LRDAAHIPPHVGDGFGHLASAFEAKRLAEVEVVDRHAPHDRSDLLRVPVVHAVEAGPEHVEVREDELARPSEATSATTDDGYVIDYSSGGAGAG